MIPLYMFKTIFFQNRFSVIRTFPLTAAQSQSLQDLESDEKFQFWRSPRTGSGCDIMADPENLGELKLILTNLKVKFMTMVEDVEK
jgi:hypothetical protein